jgi:hypothetical protein
MRWLWLILLTGTAWGQLATPVIAVPTGTYVNAVFTYVTNSVTSEVLCVTIDGTSPSAAVAGTCDKNGHIYQSNLYAGMGLDTVGVNTYKVMGTKAGSVNSAIATATYTITSTPALGLLTWVTPTQKITASAPGTNYFWPWVVTAPSGRVLVFYGYGAQAFDHGFADGVQMKYSTDNAATWHDYAPSKVTRLVLTNIGSGYSTSTCAIAAGGGVTATCTAGAPVNGAIPSITLTAPGNNYDLSQLPLYTKPILCNITGGGGTGATCQAWVSSSTTHAIAGVRMLTYGSGYSSTPTCSITQLGVGNATCTFGAPVSGAITSLTITNRGTAYAAAPAVTLGGTGGSGATASATLNDCEPGDPANCFYHDSAYGNVSVDGGGVSYNGTVIVTSPQVDLNWNANLGPRQWRSLDNGATWEPASNVTLTSTQTHSPANMLSIPSGSSGVTGSCSTGCLIQWTTYGGAANANRIMYSYDDGVTWGDVHNIPNNFPQTDEETAIAWAGAMKLIAYTRVGRSASNNLGWPEPIMAFTSSDLGTTWTQALSNLPTGPCAGINPDSYFWSDQFTKPSGFVNPNNSAQFTFMYGERFGCSTGGVTTPNDNRWRTVTFNMASVFSGIGQNTPMPQILSLAPVGLAYGSGHTTYSGAWPMTNNKVLMAWEQAVSTTAEDIYVSSFSYPTTPLSIPTASPLPDGFDNATPYSYILQASGGTPGYTWSVSAGNLAPCGLALSAAGVVNGATPIAGTCNFTALVTDSVLATASKPFTVTVQHVVPPAFTTRISGGVSIK